MTCEASAAFFSICFCFLQCRRLFEEEELKNTRLKEQVHLIGMTSRGHFAAFYVFESMVNFG